MMTRKKTIVFVIGAAALLAGFAGFRCMGAKHEQPHNAITVRKGEVVRKILATGSVSPLQTIRIGCRASGIVTSVNADYNRSVKKGDLLACFDTKEREAGLLRAQAAVKASEAILEKERIECTLADSQVARSGVLLKAGAIPQSRFEELLSAFRSATSRKDAAVAQLERDRADCAIAKEHLADARIVAPIDGIVLSRSCEPGMYVGEGATLFTIAANLNTMEVIARVSEADIGEVKPGQDASFTVDAYPGKSFAGTVKMVRMESIIDQKSVSYGVVITAANGDLLLRPDMTATIYIETARKPDALVIPAAAIADKDASPFVLAPPLPGTRKEITTGMSGSDGLVEVVSGLKEGDELLPLPEVK